MRRNRSSEWIFTGMSVWVVFAFSPDVILVLLSIASVSTKSRKLSLPIPLWERSEVPITYDVTIELSSDSCEGTCLFVCCWTRLGTWRLCYGPRAISLSPLILSSQSMNADRFLKLCWYARTKIWNVWALRLEDLDPLGLDMLIRVSTIDSCVWDWSYL